MSYKKDWKDFQSLLDARPDYRRWLYCENQEEKALWEELLRLESLISRRAAQIRKIPMPAETDGVRLSRASLHISRRAVIGGFLELLLETSLRKQDGETLNLLFSFLEAYSDLLEREANWCQK